MSGNTKKKPETWGEWTQRGGAFVTRRELLALLKLHEQTMHRTWWDRFTQKLRRAG